ncbi:contactin-associated protein 1-like [Amphiura filiformis]|uniref:contactin-associated protein 1-like n=1 Tax=Amphiura filiformis TaxID=82378 RepID=UPI003B224F31
MAARVITLSRKRDHITHVMCKLHWLPIHARIVFKCLLLTYKALNGQASVYISELISEYQPNRTLRSSSLHNFQEAPDGTVTYGRGFASAFPRSCKEVALALITESNVTLIDPDGPGNLKPFNVTCTTDGITQVHHDLEPNHHVNGPEDPGSYVRSITYIYTSLEQIVGLIRISADCRQFIEIKCYGSTFHSGIKLHHYWLDRTGMLMSNWGSPTGTNGCGCSLTQECSSPSLSCNCDENDLTWRQDGGWLNDKEHLPVTSVSVSDTGSGTEQAYVTLGTLLCS